MVEALQCTAVETILVDASAVDALQCTAVVAILVDAYAVEALHCTAVAAITAITGGITGASLETC